MIKRSMSLTALLIALLLCVAGPATIQAAERAPRHSSPAGPTPTPVNTNLLKNPGFEKTGAVGTIPSWTPSGTAKVLTFGTKPWPSQAYANSWKGGKRYLTCGLTSGQVTQAVPYIGTGNVTVRLSSYVGGTIGHKMLVAITVMGSFPQTYKSATKVLDVTNHYKKAVVTTVVPAGATSIMATIQLIPKDGAGKCKVVADTTDMWILP